jgi:hypothetical protein
VKYLNTYKLFESSISGILTDTFCDLSDDFPVDVRIGHLHDRVRINTLAKEDSSGWHWSTSFDWLGKILPAIAAKINYLDGEGIDREYCEVNIIYTRRHNTEVMRAGRLKTIDGKRRFVFEDEITGPSSMLRLYPVERITIAWPGFNLKSLNV